MSLATEIQMEGRSKNVYACEGGKILSVFEVEGDKYILIKGKYFIAYGPFTRVKSKRMNSIPLGKQLGKMAFETGKRKYLDLIIMESAEKKVLVETVFAAYVRYHYETH